LAVPSGIGIILAGLYLVPLRAMAPNSLLEAKAHGLGLLCMAAGLGIVGLASPAGAIPGRLKRVPSAKTDENQTMDAQLAEAMKHKDRNSSLAAGGIIAVIIVLVVTGRLLAH